MIQPYIKKNKKNHKKVLTSKLGSDIINTAIKMCEQHCAVSAFCANAKCLNFYGMCQVYLSQEVLQMKKEEILEASRNENKNVDLVELEANRYAGSISASVGIFICALISLLASTIADIMLYSPWRFISA